MTATWLMALTISTWHLGHDAMSFPERNTVRIATRPLAVPGAYGNALGGITRTLCNSDPSALTSDNKSYAAATRAIPAHAFGSPYGKLLGREYRANVNLLTGRKLGRACPNTASAGGYGPYLAHKGCGGIEALVGDDVWSSCYTQGGYDHPAMLPWKIQIIGPRRPELVDAGGGVLFRPPASFGFTWQPIIGTPGDIAAARMPWGAYFVADNDLSPIRGLYSPHNPVSGEQDDFAPIVATLERTYGCGPSQTYIETQLANFPDGPGDNKLPWCEIAAAFERRFMRNENAAPAAGVFATDIWYRNLFWDEYFQADYDSSSNAVIAVMGYGDYWLYNALDESKTLLGYYEWVYLRTTFSGDEALELWGFQTSASLTQLNHCFPALYRMACPNKLDDVARSDYSIDPQFMRMTYAHHLGLVEYVGDDIVWDGQDVPSLESLDFVPGYTTYGLERMANSLMSRRVAGEIQYHNRPLQFAVAPVDVSVPTDSLDPDSPNYNANTLKYISAASE